MNPATYGVNHAGHRVLRRLAQGPASREDMRKSALAYVSQGPKRIRFLTGQLLHDGFIARIGGGLFDLTDAGLRALAQLERGQPVTGTAAPHADTDPKPSVRIFVRREAA